MQQLDEPLLELDRFADGIPHDRIEALRAEHRVVWEPDPYATGGHWLVLHQRDIDEVLTNPDRFSSGRGPFLEDMPEALLDPKRMSINLMDPPGHREYRSLVENAFRPSMLKEREPIMREMARDIVDAVIDRGECDFVNDVAVHLPMRVMFMLMGVRSEDERRVVDLTNATLFGDDPRYAKSREAGFDAKKELDQFGVDLAADHRAEPRETITMDVLRAQRDGVGLTDRQFGAFFTNLISGGLDTTRNALSFGLLEFIRHPDQYAMLQADPALIPGAVEEILRFHNPVIYLRRTTTREVELAGQTIPAGEKMICVVSSANRDPALFERPDAFDITRPAAHARRNYRTFGGGPHYCLGIHQARMNLAVMLGEIARRFDNPRLSGEPKRARSMFMNGFSEMRIAFDKRG
jgi:cholest-4-en-3-one 26-monooxygenase